MNFCHLYLLKSLFEGSSRSSPYLKSFLSVPVIILFFGIGGCQSTLVVKPLQSDNKESENSIPFYMPRHDFVVSKLLLDSKGNEVNENNVGYQVSLVTRRDNDRAFKVKNKTGLLAASEFSISRDVRGRLTTISGKSEDKTLETVEAMASVVITAAAFAAQGDPQKQKLIDEKTKLQGSIVNLLLKLESLETTSPATEYKTIQEALALARSRLGEINGALKGAAGSKPFGTSIANVEVCQKAEGRTGQEQTQRIDQIASVIAADETKNGIYVFLVDAEGEEDKRPCEKLY